MTWPFILMRILWIVRRLEKMSGGVLTQYDIKLVDAYILTSVYYLGGECGQDVLAKISHLNKSTLSIQLAALEKRGIVEITMNPEYRSKNQIRLNPVGNQIVESCIAMIQKHESYLNAYFTQEEIDRLSRYLSAYERDTRINLIDHSFCRESVPGFSLLLLPIAKRTEWAWAYEKNNQHLDPNQRFIMVILAHYGGAVPYKQVERSLLLTQSCVAKQMQKLEAMGYVETIFDALDRRVKKARLTSLGENQIDSLIQIMNEMDAKGTRSLPPSEKEQMNFYLKRLCEVLSKTHQNYFG